MQVIHENMSDQEIFLIVLREYADPSNYEPWEKDFGDGPVVTMRPTVFSEKGQTARRAADILKSRGWKI